MSLTITRARASALLLGGAALSSVGVPGAAQTNAAIRIATFRLDATAEVYYAKDMGFFAKAGIDADVQSMQGSSAIAAALVSDAIDIGYCAVDILATVRSQGIALVAIAPASEYLSPRTARTGAIVVPLNSLVQQAKDLNGKVIAVQALHTLAQTGTRVWLDQNGGDSSTVKFVEIPFPAMPAALEAGHIDAAAIGEPFLSVAEKHGRVLSYGFDGISKRFLIGTWVTTQQWANANPDFVRRFAVVMRETAVWANENEVKSGEILVKYAQIDPTIAATMTRSHYAEQLSAAMMQPFIDVSAKYYGFKTFPAQELIYTPSR